MLVIANQTILGEPLLTADPRRGAGAPLAEFTPIIPATRRREARLHEVCARMAALGFEASGLLGAPDPAAAQNAVHDEQIDEIIV